MLRVIKNAIETMWDEAFDEIPEFIQLMVFLCNLLSTLTFAVIDHFVTNRDIFEELCFVVVAMVIFFFIYTIGILTRYVFVKIYEAMSE